MNVQSPPAPAVAVPSVTPFSLSVTVAFAAAVPVSVGSEVSLSVDEAPVSSLRAIVRGGGEPPPPLDAVDQPSTFMRSMSVCDSVLVIVSPTTTPFAFSSMIPPPRGSVLYGSLVEVVVQSAKSPALVSLLNWRLDAGPMTPGSGEKKTSVPLLGVRSDCPALLTWKKSAGSHAAGVTGESASKEETRPIPSSVSSCSIVPTMLSFGVLAGWACNSGARNPKLRKRFRQIVNYK